jgi:hypothetical protein
MRTGYDRGTVSRRHRVLVRTIVAAIVAAIAGLSLLWTALRTRRAPPRPVEGIRFMDCPDCDQIPLERE